MCLIKNRGEWISTEAIEVLKHNLNYSNWTDSFACSGKWTLRVDVSPEDQYSVEISMPCSRWGENHQGHYWTVFSGRLVVENKLVYIWSNETFFRELTYAESKSSFSLVIFDRLIEFVKVKSE